MTGGADHRSDEAGDTPPRPPHPSREEKDRPVLPESTRDDTDAGWGERSGDNDAWLREQRPPHWD